MNGTPRLPDGFYNLFSSRYVEYYQLILITLYEASGQSWSLLGLTEEECRNIIEEKTAVLPDGIEGCPEGISILPDGIEGCPEGVSMEQLKEESLSRMALPSNILRRLEDWGWLRRDYDETLNQYVISFPEYSQLFIDVFCRLFQEEESIEQGSILAVYSHLFTYYSDREKNNEILKSALQTSRSLQQMLANMQEGIRGYFEELSRQRTFLGIQEVLVNEMNNSDSKKYAILTTTDSFYRYKEEVKELIDKNLIENELRKQECSKQLETEEKDSVSWRHRKRALEACEEAMDLLLLINREFDGIERRYQKLIDQKRIFAKRAAARARYILAEGDSGEDRTKAFLKLLDRNPNRDEILEQLSLKLALSEEFSVVKEKSLARPKNAAKREFAPQAMKQEPIETAELEEFVVKPLYTQAEIRKFQKKNEQNGVFTVTQDTVKTMEDLEKLLFVWQEAMDWPDDGQEIETGETFTTPEGFSYTGFTITAK